MEVARRIEVDFVPRWAMQQEGAAQISVAVTRLEFDRRTVSGNDIRGAALLDHKFPAIGLEALHLMTIAYS